MSGATSTFARLGGLGLVVDGYRLERLETAVSSEFTRVTTVVQLHGVGEEGLGEDVTYMATDHEALHARPAFPLTGEWTLESFSAHVGGLELFPAEPEMAAFRHYRRWAFESAALDLALRQAGTSLAAALERDARPVRFVVSMRLGVPSSVNPVRRLLEMYPTTRLKLDPVPDWSRELVDELARMEIVDIVDLKGAYRGTVVDNPPNADLYRLVAEAFPDAWIEDPALTDETEAVLREHRHRITWDAPIHSVTDIEGLPFPPRTLNIKPSRFGSLHGLFAAYDYCAERGIGTYGGGQFELGVGRGQIQYLASLLHADAPNDVAPGGYNLSPPEPGLPTSPLAPMPAPTGFRWG